jgi:hypothetical protein
MTDRTAIRTRYLRDPLPVRLGGIAANLARVRSFAAHDAHGFAVAQLIEESAFFIEWMAPDAPLDVQVALLDLQRLLARWRRHWEVIWLDPSRRAETASQAKAWSDRLLVLVGHLQAAG